MYDGAGPNELVSIQTERDLGVYAQDSLIINWTLS